MTSDFDALSGAQTLGLTGWAEGRSYFDPKRGWLSAPAIDMIAVMCTPLNRFKLDPARFGATIKQVCLEREQYSCWNPERPHLHPTNHDDLMAQVPLVLADTVKDKTLMQCLVDAQRIISSAQADIVSGATHYYSPASMIPPGSMPTWAVGKTAVAQYGGQLFFKGV